MSPDDEHIEQLFYSVIGAFFEVYNTLGHGLFEYLHMKALELELRHRGHVVRREVLIPVRYKGHELGDQRLDMLVDETLVVEGKSTEVLPRTVARQVHNYLRATQLRHGLLLHFGPEARFYRFGRRD
jgi:GxxExxY protein